MKAWGGFVSGRLDWFEANDEWGGVNRRKIPAIFKSQKAAKQQYQDVRPINIIQSFGHDFEIDNVIRKSKSK